MKPQKTMVYNLADFHCNGQPLVFVVVFCFFKQGSSHDLVYAINGTFGKFF